MEDGMTELRPSALAIAIPVMEAAAATATTDVDRESYQQVADEFRAALDGTTEADPHPTYLTGKHGYWTEVSGAHEIIDGTEDNNE